MMQMQRRFGKLRTRSADESQVSVLLKDYYDADKMLTKIIDATKSWRDAWTSTLGHQYNLINEFESAYAPIAGGTEDHEGPDYVETPRVVMARTSKLRETYQELRTDLLEEINMVDARIIQPGIEAKEFIQPMKKVIKKREDKKLDYERYQGRVDAGKKKLKRTDKDNAALAKNEGLLATSTEEYRYADERLRQSLPGIIAAAFSILPPLLSAQILIQNTLLAQYYTVLHNFCEDTGFPSPAPLNEDILAAWDASFRPVQTEIETGIAIVATGKTVKHSMRTEDAPQGGIRNGLKSRLTSGQQMLRPGQASQPSRSSDTSPTRSETDRPPPPDLSSKPKISSSPSASLMALISPPATEESTTSSPGEFYTPGTGGAFSPAAPRADYFARDRLPSNSSMSTAIAAKKKPPPPPPKPKRMPSSTPWVTALYSFDGQNDGDLTFREGDRIKVVRKTDSTDDWWEGELRGMKGAFPANYVQPI
ncbi:MAG: hypothetical protein M4579_002849 [Chaenotheca gracillima]|nr:MAG: hypothetical protein M4579_002849 [Chaenotheca gracillima]